jgi:hypothetical protein
MARARILLRIGDRIWWTEHTLDGYGPTPEAARVDYEHRMCELAEDGLEPAAPLKTPELRAHAMHGGGGVVGYRYGHGLVRIRRRP